MVYCFQRLLFIIILLGVSLFPAQLNAFSISPSEKKIEDISPLFPYTFTTYIGKNELEKVTDVEIQKKGSGASYISFTKKQVNFFENPKESIYIKVDPTGAEPGEYEATLRYTPVVPQKEGVVPVKVELFQKLEFTVTSTLFGGINIEKAKIEMAGAKQGVIYLQVRNTGNRELHMMDVHVEDKGHRLILPTKGEVSPFEVKEVQIPFSDFAFSGSVGKLTLSLYGDDMLIEKENIPILYKFARDPLQERGAYAGLVLLGVVFLMSFLYLKFL